MNIVEHKVLQAIEKSRLEAGVRPEQLSMEQFIEFSENLLELTR